MTGVLPVRVGRKIAQHSKIREMPWIVRGHATTRLYGRLTFKIDDDTNQLRWACALHITIFPHLVIAQKVGTFNAVDVAFVEDPGLTIVHTLTNCDWYERHAAAAPSATQIDNGLTGHPIVMPTNDESARAGRS